MGTIQLFTHADSFSGLQVYSFFEMHLSSSIDTSELSHAVVFSFYNPLIVFVKLIS